MKTSIPLLSLFISLVWSCSSTSAPAPPAGPVTGILGAFPEEVKYLLTQLEQPQEHHLQHITFTEGTLQGHRVIIALSGMGKVNAAITTTLMMDHFKPTEIIFTGIAGGINPALKPGDVVIGSLIAHHDFGTLTNDSMIRRPTYTPFIDQEEKNPLYFPCDSMLVVRANEVAHTLTLDSLTTSQGKRPPHIINGIIVTGDVFVSSETLVHTLWHEMHAEAVEMEGAAVAQACWQQQTPFIVIRSISDHAGSDAHAEMENFYQVAAHNSAKLVMGMVGKLPAHHRATAL